MSKLPQTSSRDSQGTSLRAQVLLVVFGPWPIRPLLTGVLLFAIFQFAASDVPSTARLDTARVFAAVPVSIARAAVIALILWAALTVHRWVSGGGQLTRIAYLAISMFAGVCSGTMRFWLSEGDLSQEPHLYAVFVVRSIVLLLILQSVLGLADAQLRAHVARADRALAQVEHQQRVVLETEERAKDQVSRFLHNRVQSGLVAIGMELRQLEADSTPDKAARISSIRDALETVRAEDVRQASRALNPDIPTIGLGQALRELADRYSPGMQVSIEVHGLETQPKTVSPDHLLACYRIVEQGLLNSAVHGHASSAHVLVTVSKAGSAVTLTDNGVGLHDSAPTPGAGMALMDAWTARYGGSWSLTPNHNEPGTTLTAALQLTQSP